MNIYLNATKGPFLYTQLKKIIKLFMNVSPRMRIELIFQMIKYTNHPVEWVKQRREDKGLAEYRTYQ